MTGRDLIIYIMSNNLEDEPIFKDGKFIGFLTDAEVATKLGVGISTINVMFEMQKLPGVKIGGNLYIFSDYETRLRGAYEKNI